MKKSILKNILNKFNKSDIEDDFGETEAEKPKMFSEPAEIFIPHEEVCVSRKRDSNTIISLDASEVIEEEIGTGSELLDVAILEEIKKAKKNGVKFAYFIDPLVKSNVPIDKIRDLLVSLLDDAIDAAKKCEDRKDVGITIRTIGSSSSIIIENTKIGNFNPVIARFKKSQIKDGKTENVFNILREYKLYHDFMENENSFIFRFKLDLLTL